MAMVLSLPGLARAAPPEAGAVEGPVEGPQPASSGLEERSLEIVALEIRGRKQVTAREVLGVLEAETLVEGERVTWPEDPKVDRAIQRLSATGYFEQVAIRLMPIGERRDQAVLIVDLRERGSLVVRDIHAAGSRFTPFAGGFELMERNLAGRQVHLGGAFVVGTRPVGVDNRSRQHAYRLFTELPALAGSPIGVVASAHAILANEPFRVAGDDSDPSPSHFDTLPYSRFGGVVGVTLPFHPDFMLGIDLRVEAIEADVPQNPTRTLADGSLRPLDLQLDDGLHVLSSAEFSLAWDERNRAAILGKGGHIRLDVQLSSPAIGSRYEYLRVLVGGGYSFRLPWGHWLSPTLWGGQIAGRAPRFEMLLPGDLSDWTPGRTMGLQYSTRWPIDVFGTGVDAYPLAQLGGRLDLEYGIPLFRRPKTAFVYGGYLFVGAGLFTLTGTRPERAERRAAGEWVAPLGFNANFGLKLDTAIGTFDISVGNILERLPL
jgi:outer membrane protein insertion porin family